MKTRLERFFDWLFGATMTEAGEPICPGCAKVCVHPVGRTSWVCPDRCNGPTGSF